MDVDVGEARDLRLLAAARVTELAGVMGSRLPELTRALHTEVAGAVPELRGDSTILELLGAGIEGNLETLARVMRYGIPIDEVPTPAAAQEYARRLAQRGISPIALIRAYRLGQQRVLDWAFDEIARKEPDPRVAFAAAQMFLGITFQFVDTLAEDLVHEYESERERWVATRNTLRTATIRELVAGESVPLATAEAALGYRLRQTHLGVLVWESDDGNGPSPALDLRRLEQLIARIGASLGSTGHPLFVLIDRSTGWGWIPLARQTPPGPPEVEKVIQVLNRAGAGLRAAFGTPAAGITGFRVTHEEADRARQVALHARTTELRLITFADPGVRAASMLMTDLDATRRLVATSLGTLAADTAKAARLRDTLLAFLIENGSYTATAERVHLHKSTVRYRVEQALAQRGRPLHDQRLELELALLACHWLGPSVLASSMP